MWGKLVLAATGVALLAATSALADDPTVRINAADQAKARAALVRRSDLPAGWTGGPHKAEPLTGSLCAGFDPKESDLVVTGHAESRFRRVGFELEADVQVMKSAAQVRTDFARTIKPALVRCIETVFRKGAGASASGVTARRLAFPRVGAMTAAYRVSATVEVQGTKVPMLTDFVFFGEGRGEFTLVVFALPHAARELVPFEASLARAVRARAPA